MSRPPLKPGEVNDQVTFINEDSSGGIWMGTIVAGINRYDPLAKKITHYNSSFGFPDHSGWAAYRSRDGVFWIATQEEKLYLVESLPRTIQTINLGTKVNGFLDDRQGSLWEDLKTEINEGNKEDAISLVNNVLDNEKKVLYHGKRTDGIVKSILQHSRSSTGQKEPADINKLADEYLRLAYHGPRAKDKSFNASLVTHFDEALEKINIIPQDIGRVLLNLYNNAFYAVSEKQKQTGTGYEPVVEISTRQRVIKPKL